MLIEHAVHKQEKIMDKKTEYRIASLSNRRIDPPLNMSVPYILLKLFPHATEKPSKQTKKKTETNMAFFSLLSHVGHQLTHIK